ncbi:MAG: thioredoxin [Acutalibacteraceae bacterium]|nr:thioredoxin [Acutalibacteraceae bacterium]
MSEIKITKENFNQVITSDVPVLIDFFATWCGPCLMMSPVIKELAEQYQGKAVIGKVNVDEEPELAAAFGVTSIPMFAVLKNGKVADTKVGAVPKANLEAMLK